MKESDLLDPRSHNVFARLPEQAAKAFLESGRKGGHPQGVWEHEAVAMPLSETLIIPARCGVRGKNHRRGQEVSFLADFPEPREGDRVPPVFEMALPNDNAEVNACFNGLFEENGIECQGRANGLAVRAAQVTRVRHNYVRSPREWAFYVVGGSRNLVFTGNDIDGGGSAKDFGKSAAWAAILSAEQMYGSCNSATFLHGGFLLDGATSTNLHDNYFEACRVGVVAGGGAQFCNIHGRFDNFKEGLIARFDGRGPDGHILTDGRATPGTITVGGVIARTARPFYVDRDGKSRTVEGWQAGFNSPRGWAFQITA